MRLSYILPLFFVFMAYACFEDDTTYDTTKISEISIDTSKLQKVYNIDKNHFLNITPAVTQTDKNEPLTYEWQINYEVCSDSSSLSYMGTELGTFPIRLKVSNRFGSTFYKFTLNVNSAAYEEGLLILSEDKDGSSMLSFMRKYSAEELAEGKVEQFETHCFTTNNPDISFAKKPTDIVKREGRLFISCEESPTVYMINDKTFEAENISTAPEYPDYIPQQVLIPDNGYRSSPVLCENGKIYELATLEGLVLEHPFLTSTYEKMSFIIASSWSCGWYLWDKNTNSPAYFNGYGVTDLQTYPGVFKDHTPVLICDGSANDGYFVVLSEKNGQMYKTLLGNYLISYEYNDDYEVIGSNLDLREQAEVSGNPGISQTTPYASNNLYLYLLYAKGNQIYRWYYTDTSFPTSSWITVELENAQINTISMSPDNKQIYVGVSQPTKDGLNGSLYIYDSNTGKPVEGSPYPNVAYKPVKVMYKVK